MITIPTPSPNNFGAFKPSAPAKKPIAIYFIIAIVILAVLAGGYYLYFYQDANLFKIPDLPTISPLTATDAKVKELPPLSFDLFDSSFYKSLKSYGKLPIVADSLGRTNPFIPY